MIAPLAADREAVWTLDRAGALALAAVRALDDGTHRTPLRVVVSHAIDGAWVRASRTAWPRASVLAVGPDQRSGEASGCLKAPFSSHYALRSVAEWSPDLVLGAPPRACARDHLVRLRSYVRCRVAWLMPLDLASSPPWADVLRRMPPAVVRSVLAHVGGFRAALWEWWAGRAPTVVVPMGWRA